MAVLRAALGVVAETADEALPPPPWLGAWMDEEAGIAARVEAAGAGRVRLYHGQNPEVLDLMADGQRGPGRGGRGWCRRRADRGRAGCGWSGRGRTGPCCCSKARRGRGAPFSGRYVCDEIGARLEVADAGGVMFGAFPGVPRAGADGAAGARGAG